MTAVTADRTLIRSSAPNFPVTWLLQAFALAIMIFPSDIVLKAVGGGGYLGALIAYCAFLAWVASTLLGIHNPLEYRYPVRISLCTMWLVSLASYALMNRAMLNATQLNASDRWLMQLAGVSGIVLVTAEGLRSLEDIHKVLRALMWGGAVCGVIAALQFWLRLDVTPYLRTLLPGFSVNQAAGTIAIGSRGGLNRVAGTATDPIELGVANGMLLPLAIYMARNDTTFSRWKRWLPVICITLAISVSVSRSAILAAAVALGVLIVCLPPARRLGVLAAIPVVAVGIFVTAHGLLGTLKQFFLLGTSDDSISHRVNNYPYVEHLVLQSPWLGQGGGTYTAQASIHILDNQYLDTAIELGLVGVAVLIFFFLWPAFAALSARRRTADPQLREICGALAASAFAATFCAGTFDAFGFPMFVYVLAIVIGLIGAVWLLATGQYQAEPGVCSLARRGSESVNGYPATGSGVTGSGGGK
jgi:O-antigen ligase